MGRIARLVRQRPKREHVEPTMVMIDEQTVRGGRAGPNVGLHIGAPPKGSSGFVLLAPLYKVEHAFARLGRWRRLARCDAGTEASARAWLEVVCVAYLFARLRAEST